MIGRKKSDGLIVFSYLSMGANIKTEQIYGQSQIEHVIKYHV